MSGTMGKPVESLYRQARCDSGGVATEAIGITEPRWLPNILGVCFAL